MQKRQQLIVFRGSRSQLTMANQYGITQQTWSNWEQGKSIPDPYMMKRLEIDSGFPMEELFFDIFNKNKLLEKKTTA